MSRLPYKFISFYKNVLLLLLDVSRNDYKAFAFYVCLTKDVLESTVASLREPQRLARTRAPTSHVVVVTFLPGVDTGVAGCDERRIREIEFQEDKSST